MKLGLSGGIGCGKSTVGRLFAELGWKRLDSDEIVREILNQDSAVHEAVKTRWGSGAITTDQSLDRAYIAQQVFHNQAELRWWEGVLHPRVREIWQGALAAEPERNWLIEIPLLFENDLESHFDFTICVEADQETQLRRLAVKGLDREQSLSRINNQLPVLAKVKRADYVLSNAGSLEFLKRQVGRLSGLLQSAPQ
ncbi:MAG: dephospho-CoA kinase [Verrucomicrobiota bacterium]